MWIVTDKVMNKLLDGDFTDVVIVKQEKEDITVRKLFTLQDKFVSYQGFRKFFRNKLQSIIKDICFIEDSGFIGKIVRYITGM